MTSRSDAYAALFALASNVVWGSPPKGFVGTSRRVRDWSALPEQPYLCQAEHAETVAQVTRMPAKLTLEASWIIYHTHGKGSDTVPADETNAILDAVFALFPSDDPDNLQTLGGRVHKAWIEGRVLKAQGDLDGQTMLVVPIRMLMP